MSHILSEASSKEICGYLIRQVDKIVIKDMLVELVVDMKGVTLKTMTTHSFISIITTVIKEVTFYYPDCLKRIYFLSTPIFVPELLDTYLKPLISSATFSKLIVTGESTHADIPFDFLLESDTSL